MDTFDLRINYIIIMKYLQHRPRHTVVLSLGFYIHALDRVNYNYVYIECIFGIGNVSADSVIDFAPCILSDE